MGTFLNIWKHNRMRLKFLASRSNALQLFSNVKVADVSEILRLSAQYIKISNLRHFKWSSSFDLEIKCQIVLNLSYRTVRINCRLESFIIYVRVIHNVGSSFSASNYNMFIFFFKSKRIIFICIEYEYEICLYVH